jgi:hypothetical protein
VQDGLSTTLVEFDPMAKKHQKIDDLSLSELQPATERLKVQSLTTFLANTIEFYDLFNIFSTVGP